VPRFLSIEVQKSPSAGSEWWKTVEFRRPRPGGARPESPSLRWIRSIASAGASRASKDALVSSSDALRGESVFFQHVQTGGSLEQCATRKTVSLISHCACLMSPDGKRLHQSHRGGDAHQPGQSLLPFCQQGRDRPGPARSPCDRLDGTWAKSKATSPSERLRSAILQCLSLLEQYRFFAREVYALAHRSPLLRERSKALVNDVCGPSSR